MIIQWSHKLILQDWVKNNRWHKGCEYNNGFFVYKITIIESINKNSVQFWDELRYLNDLYHPPSNLSIEELKINIDQFLLTMKELKAFL